MFEVKLKENETGLKVLINDFPDLSQITNSDKEIFFSGLEKVVFSLIESNDLGEGKGQPP